MVRPSTPAVYQQRMIIGRSQRDVLAELRRRSLAGELHSAGDGIQVITRGPHAGSYAIPVYLRTIERATARPPIWRKVAGVAAGALLLAGLVGWLLSTLSGVALIALMLAALGLLARRVRRTVTVSTTTTTKITVR